MEEDTTISNQHSEPSDFEHVDRGADSPAEASNLPRSCTVLTCNNPENPFGGEQTFYIVGTAHVSADSCLDVRRVIRHVKPEVLHQFATYYPSVIFLFSLFLLQAKSSMIARAMHTCTPSCLWLGSGSFLGALPGSARHLDHDKARGEALVTSCDLGMLHKQNAALSRGRFVALCAAAGAVFSGVDQVVEDWPGATDVCGIFLDAGTSGRRLGCAARRGIQGCIVGSSAGVKPHVHVASHVSEDHRACLLFAPSLAAMEPTDPARLLQVGAKVMLGDRPVRVTLVTAPIICFRVEVCPSYTGALGALAIQQLKVTPQSAAQARTWAALSTWSKLKFIWALIWTGFSVPDDLKAEVEAMKVTTFSREFHLFAVRLLPVSHRERLCAVSHACELKRLIDGRPSVQDADVLTQAMKEMAAEFPQLVRPLIHERDEYMAFMLRALASKCFSILLFESTSVNQILTCLECITLDCNRFQKALMTHCFLTPCTAMSN